MPQLSDYKGKEILVFYWDGYLYAFDLFFEEDLRLRVRKDKTFWRILKGTQVIRASTDRITEARYEAIGRLLKGKRIEEITNSELGDLQIRLSGTVTLEIYSGDADRAAYELK